MKIILYLIIFISVVAYAKNNQTDEYELIINSSNKINIENIAKVIGAKEKSSINIFNKEFTINKEFIENISATLKGYLETKGYFDSKIEVIKRDKKVIINIKLGKPIKVADIKISSDINIKELIKLKKGDIFSSEKFEKIKSNIKKYLYKNGYCNPKVNTKAYIDLYSHLAKLVFDIKKNKLCYFGKINISKKPKDISNSVILSRLDYKKGEKFNIEKIENSYYKLNSLNVFANTQIRYNLDNNTQYVDSNISLDKRDKLNRYLFAIGADTEIGVRAKGLWEARNFLGNAKKISIKTEVSKHKKEIKGEYFIPAGLSFNDIYFDYYLKVGYSNEVTSAYREKDFFINSYYTFSKNRWNIKSGITLERLIIDLKANLPYKIGGNYNILYPYLSIVYDSRDSKIDPQNGYYVGAYGEYGLSYGEKSVEYFKYILEGRVIKTFGKLTLSSVAKVGAIHVKSFHLPASKLFYGGGLFSNRAYGKNDIGYITSSKSFSVLGGKSFLNLQLEANYQIYKKFYGAIFFDSTMISKDEYNFKGNRIDTLGFGIRYKTPIGPIKLDIGFNIHKTKDYAISIMLGQSF